VDELFQMYCKYNKRDYLSIELTNVNPAVGMNDIFTVLDQSSLPKCPNQTIKE